MDVPNSGADYGRVGLQRHTWYVEDLRVRKVLPFAVRTVLAVASLAFVVLFGMRVLHPLPDDELPFTGWQTASVQWGLLGLALVTGLLSALRAVRRLRRLEGEGFMIGLPALLAGLLLSAAAVGGASRAVGWAELHTDANRQAVVQAERQSAALRDHPIVVHSSLPPASPDMDALLPHAAELGAGWYAAQRPASLRTSDGLSVDGGHSLLVQGASGPAGWDNHWLLTATVRTYRDAGTASRQARGMLGTAQALARHQLISGQQVTVAEWGGTLAGMSAVRRQGATVWNLRLTDQHAGEPISEAEVQRLLRLVVAATSH
ncbi:MAG: hypothetical protein QOD70_349 [Frankiales bacterium]|nr:hypothetical protein [Frankiales bacterium]